MECCQVKGPICLVGGYWNNFGPIAQAVKPLLGVSNATIALWANYGPFGYILTILPSTWLLDVKGLRMSCLVCAWLVFLGSLIKCFVAEANLSLCVTLIHIGQLLNGLAGPISMSIGTYMQVHGFWRSLTVFQCQYW
jgi:FLVCR family MFS transporter